jgi:tetratricopeptide (TPR) repeat protein
MQSLRILTGLVLLLPVSAASWNLARTDHFEVWSDAAPAITRSLAAGMERLHLFFVRQTGMSPRSAVRVICFASEREFREYRIRPGAGGYSLTTPQRDYIVIPASASYEMRVPAHEYAHLLIHSSGWKLPEWLAEGISEVVSSVRIGERHTFIGGDLPGRSQLLKTSAWMTPAELFAFGLKGTAQDLAREPLFYSQSWALAEMLIVSPAYAPRFPALFATLAKGSSSQAAIEGVYGASIDAIFRDLRERQSHGPAPIALPGIAGAASTIRVEAVTSFDARVMLADLRYAGGDSDRALSLYRALAAERPDSPDIPAAIGLIALERGDPQLAIEEWRKAIALGIRDADLCFRYAMLADSRGLGPQLVRAALERALVLRPDFDAVHMRLAMMDQNEGRADACVRHLRAMRPPSAERAWQYYSTLADALLDLRDRAEARQAAVQARQYAATDSERARAAQLAYLADTELSVEIATDSQGRREFRTVRVPVDAPARNPFIEADEQAERVEGKLDQVECSDTGIRLLVSTARGPLVVAVPDPSRVQIRNGGGEKFEFTCGPQPARAVAIEYAAGGVLRGLEFR